MIRRNQTGQVLVSTALALVVLLGASGLAMDMGVLRFKRRLQQTAADGAAVAGASNLAYGGVQAGAQGASAANGFTDNTGGGACVAPPTGLAAGSVTVTVCPGPSTGPHTGDAKYVEVFITAGHPTYFMKIFGVSSETITARAVATNVSGGANSGCLYTLGSPTSSIEGVNVNGSVVVNAPTCGIVDNGNFNTQGNALTIKAGSFGMAGDANQTGNGGTVTCTDSSTSCPTPNMPASGDPLAYLTPPPVQTPSFGNVTTSGTQTIQPGTYSSLTVGKNSTVTANPGIYYINGSGGLGFNGNASLTGSGVMFYFTNGATINATGGGNAPDIQVSPPTSGPYAGVTFYQDPSDTAAPSLGGDNQSSFQGILYFPNVELTFFGNNVTYSTGIIVAKALSFSGNPTVNLSGSAGTGPGISVITRAILVE